MDIIAEQLADIIPEQVHRVMAGYAKDDLHMVRR